MEPRDRLPIWDDKPGDVIDARYLLEQMAGSGGMGAVYRAIDRQRGEVVALKLLVGDDGAEIERFACEAEILAELRHPAIVRYVGHGTTELGRPYVAMEWLEGIDLATVLRRRRLSPAEGMVMARRAAEALGHAHARGVIHRDVKPSNLFLPGGDVARLKLIDFGVARVGRTERITRTGMILGTPAYMAPEQVQAAPELTAAADVFSLGCVLFEALTHRPVFEGANLFARLAKILFQEAPRLRSILPDAPVDLDALLDRALAKAPSDRPADGNALASGLAAIAELSPSWITEEPGTAPISDILPSMTPLDSGGLSLTRSERRLVTLVVAGDARSPAGARRGRDPRAEELGEAIAPFGGRLDALAGGAMIVTVWGAGSAVDRAERAAHCALALRARFPDLPIAMATGRGSVSAQVIAGAVLDQAVRALGAAEPGAVRIDASTSEMLRARFHVEARDGGLCLHGERAADERAELLLGRATPFVGRGRELFMLQGMLAGCIEESSAAAALVLGPAGAGKSRLRRELLARVGRRDGGLTVLTGRGHGGGPVTPFAVAAGALRSAAGIGRDDGPDRARERLAARVGRHLKGASRARAVEFLGAMIGLPPASADDAVHAAIADPMLMGDSMRAAWEEWLAAELAAQPVLIVVEDLHWGDEATVKLVDSTLKNLQDRPLMVLALARPEVGARFPALWNERSPHTIKLSPLQRKACEQIAREALGSGAPLGVIAQITERAAGNPFHLEELIRAVASGRDDALPETELAAVEARLDAEGGDAKRALRAASIFGERFSREGVAVLLGGVEQAPATGEMLEMLAARELIAATGVATSRAPSEYVFRHDLVREAAYAMLTDADRVLGHRLAGEWLEQIGHPEAATIAEHLRRGEELQRAAGWYRRAAERALEANDLTLVLDLVARGEGCGAGREVLAGLLLSEAEARLWRGELPPAEDRGRRAMELFPMGSTAWFRAATQAGLAAGKRGDFDAVEVIIGTVIAAASEPGLLDAGISCLSQLAVHLIFGGRYGAADDLLADIDRLAAERGRIEPHASARLHEVRAVRATVSGDLGVGLDAFQAALAGYQQIGDARNAAATRSNLGFVFAELGDFAAAERALRAAADAVGRMGLHDVGVAVHQNLGRALALGGSLEEARVVEQRALEASIEQGDPRMAGSTRAYLAQIALLAGDFLAAERAARASVEALSVAPPLRAGAQAVLARALLAQGRVGEAFEASREAFTQLEEAGSLEEGEAMVRLVHAEVLAARGDRDALHAVIGAARAALLARAEKISDPVWRHRFLHGVPENARTLALAEEAEAGD